MVSHPVDQGLVSGYPGIGKVLSQLPNEVRRLLVGQANPAFEIPDRFGDDLIRPARHVKAGLFSETQKRVSKWGLDQDAGIQDNEKIRRHSSSAPSGSTTLS
jgi:hypothetical protein